MFRTVLITIVVVATVGCGSAEGKGGVPEKRKEGQLPTAAECEQQTSESDCLDLGCTYFVEVWEQHIDDGECTPPRATKMCLVTESGETEYVGDASVEYVRGEGDEYQVFSHYLDLGRVVGWTHYLSLPDGEQVRCREQNENEI